MASDSLMLREEDSVITGLIRSELLKMLVSIQCQASNLELEEATRQLISQLDDLQLAFDMSKRNEHLPLEPVNISEVADFVLHKFSQQTKSAKIISSYKHKMPVLAHRSSLAKSLESMLYGVVDSSSIDSGQQVIELNTLRCETGVRLGVYSKSLILEAKDFRGFKKNNLASDRSISSLSPMGIANLFIANTLLNAMGVPFRTSINQKDRGIATVLPFSKQLELIAS